MTTLESLWSWRDKVEGTIRGVRLMDKSERLALPSKAFGEDYNRTLAALRTALPSIEDRLPPSATFHEEAGRGFVSDFSFGEFVAYFAQMFELLRTQISALEREQDQRDLERRQRSDTW